MISELEAFYITQEEPTRSCLLALRRYIMDFNPLITETWTHRMPMFRYRGKLFCYLWIEKMSYVPYIGIYRGLEVKHPKLELGKRKKMKIMLVDPEMDLPIQDLQQIFSLAIKLYE